MKIQLYPTQIYPSTAYIVGDCVSCGTVVQDSIPKESQSRLTRIIAERTEFGSTEYSELSQLTRASIYLGFPIQRVSQKSKEMCFIMQK